MLVRDVMTSHVTACRVDCSLASVASKMWLADCGAVPVLDDRSRVVGIVTDRDICFALAWKDRSRSDTWASRSAPCRSCRA